MIETRKLRRVLLLAGALLTFLPVAFIAVSFFVQAQHVADEARRVTVELNRANLDNAVRGVYGLARLYQTESERHVAIALDVARHVVRRTGEIRQEGEKVPWRAVNQLSHEGMDVLLPAMVAGDAWLEQVAVRDEPVPVVDEVSRLAGATCTIFQRMNREGDMLRVATTVTQADGSRAVGTYIPRVEPDGSSNAVVEALLSGRTFVGRSWVVDQWYISAYEPFRDQSGEVFAALYVGFPQRQLDALEEVVAQIQIGETGYAYVIDGKGQYVVHPGPDRAVEDVAQATAAQREAVAALIGEVRKLPPGEVRGAGYEWPLPGGEGVCRKEVRLMYFEAWDWIIGAGACEDDVERAAHQVAAVNARSRATLLTLASAVLLGAFTLFWIVSGRIARHLTDTNHRLAESVSRLEDSSRTMRALAAFSEYVQACAEESELYAVVSRTLERLLPGTSGSLGVFSEEDQETARIVAHWGPAPRARVEVDAVDCWAIRRGAPHVMHADGRAPRCRHMERDPVSVALCLPMGAQGRVLGMLNVVLEAGHDELYEGRQREIIEERQILVSSVLERLAPAIVGIRLRERLRLESVQDALTGLYNRRHMESALERELSFALRHQTRVGVLMLDIDHFKRVNDEHGHAAGDAVLAALGPAVRARFRNEDIACRYGGEEFAVILGGITPEDLQARAEALRAQLAALPITHGNLALSVTVSIGIALFPEHGETGAELLRAADLALYQAKAAGRNRVALFQRA